MAVYRYPIRNPSDGYGDKKGVVEAPTEAVDYLMIRRERYSYNDKNVPAFYSRKSPGNQQTVKAHPDRCYIAMPPQIQTAYTPAFRRADIGVGGIGALGLMSSGAAGDFTKMAEILQDSAKSAVPEFSTSAVLSMLNATNQFVGLQGRLDLNSITALQSGQIFNPYSEQIFQGVGFRTHNFAFKFYARNRKESEEIRRIIQYIKVGSLPKIRSGDFNTRFINKDDVFDNPNDDDVENKSYGKNIKRKQKDIFTTDFYKSFKNEDLFDNYASKDRYFSIPDRFQLRFVRFGGNQTDGGLRESQRRDLMFKIYPSVCTGIQVNYTPDNQYTSLRNPSTSGMDVPAAVMTVSFAETRLLTAKDAEDGY